jgi:hypothetical protein
MKDQQTIAQFLNVTNFPFEIKDKNGKLIYREISNGFWSKSEYDCKDNEIRFENSNGFWHKSEYDDRGNVIRFENSDGYWIKREYDCKGNEIRFEISDGYWHKREYDCKGNEIRFENSNGEIIDKRPKPIIELTLEDIAKMKGVSASQIRIKE